MQIGIFTFHCAINYGAVLQAYCLQEYLKSLGHDVYIIDYRPDYLIKPYRNFNYQIQSHRTLLQKGKEFIRTLFSATIRYKRKRRFNTFIKTRLQLIDLKSVQNSCFDILVYGSDQIWNPKITGDYDITYFGAIDQFKYCKKISYAASIGNIDNIKNPERFGKLLEHFDSISVREETLKKYIETNFKLKPTTTLDPVLLSDRVTLTRIADAHNLPHKPYLLVFQLEHDEHVVAFAQQVAKAMGLNLVDAISSAESVTDKRIRQTLSPEELVAYIEHADYIISTSFHGTALSISLQKQFCAIEIFANISDRIHQLLNCLEIGHRIINLGGKIPQDTLDYSVINKKLERIRKLSIDFIDNALINANIENHNS